MSLNLKRMRNSKSNRELADIDYAHKLSTSQKEWLEVFTCATVGGSVDDMSALVGPSKLGAFQKEMYAEQDARRRDLTYVGVQVNMPPEVDGDVTEDEGGSSPDVDTPRRCSRCYWNPCRCLGPRQRNHSYADTDYFPPARNEDTLVGELELKKRMQAYDLLPYGDSPKGLQQGHMVKVCLPHHLLEKAWGYVLDYRSDSNEYLIRTMSKQGLRDKEGRLPKATVVWVKPEGLRRFQSILIKGSRKPADTRKTEVK